MKRYHVIIACILILIVIIAGIYYWKEHYTADKSPNNMVLSQIKYNFSLLSPDYAKIPLQEGKKSYTQNKKVIVMCLRDPTTKKYYDMNTLMYVAIHELSHMISVSYSEKEHNDEFKKIFSSLLNKAKSIGIYDPRLPLPSVYCGVSNT